MKSLKDVECLKDVINNNLEIRFNGIDDSIGVDVFDGNIEIDNSVDFHKISSGEVVNLTLKIPNAIAKIDYNAVLENVKTV